MKEVKDLENYSKYSQLNMLIRDAAIRGNMDCLGPIDINWKVCGRYVLVLIEEYTGKWWYKVFVSPREFHYERNRVMYPLDDMDDLQYVFGYYENMLGTEKALQKLQAGNWMDCLFAEVESFAGIERIDIFPITGIFPKTALKSH